MMVRLFWNLKRKLPYCRQVITDEIPSLDMTVFEFLESGRPIEQLEKKITKYIRRVG